MVAGNYLGSLFGCRIQEAFENNMYVKHILGFLTLYFFITLVEDQQRADQQQSSQIEKKKSPGKKIINAMLIYLAFMISTKMSIKFWVPFIIVLGSIYVLFIAKEYFESEQNEIVSENIENDKENKKNIKQPLVSIKTLSAIQKYLSIAGLVLLVTGFFYYIGEKKIEYGKDFSYYNFMLGNPTCSFDTPEIKESLLEILAIGLKPGRYYA